VGVGRELADVDRSVARPGSLESQGSRGDKVRVAAARDGGDARSPSDAVWRPQ
jgi:hypothetical protein